MVITAVNSITPVGHDAAMTAAAARAGISRLVESEDYFDIEGNPITAARIAGISDDEDDVARMGMIIQFCLESLLEKYFQDSSGFENEIHLLLGVATLSRPGPRYEGKNQEVAQQCVEIARKWAQKATLQVITSGHPATMHCLEIAGQLLKKDPDSLCLIGGIDSLLALETLNWFEEAGRLKSETFGRNQSFSPGEAVGFMVVETKNGALRRTKKILAEVTGIGLAKESAPFLSEQPSKGEGLTKACRTALRESACKPGEIAAVLGDLNGEFFRSKEWSYAEFRCFGNNHETRPLWHPADCMGSVGAASGAILINMATVALTRGWIKNYALVFCSDDEGECGAVVLKGNSN